MQTGAAARHRRRAGPWRYGDERGTEAISYRLGQSWEEIVSGRRLFLP
jgi:hypothetical protein